MKRKHIRDKIMNNIGEICDQTSKNETKTNNNRIFKQRQMSGFQSTKTIIMNKMQRDLLIKARDWEKIMQLQINCHCQQERKRNNQENNSRPRSERIYNEFLELINCNLFDWLGTDIIRWLNNIGNKVEIKSRCYKLYYRICYHIDEFALKDIDNKGKTVWRQKKMINNMAKKLINIGKEFRYYAAAIFAKEINRETIKEIPMKILNDLFKVHKAIVAEKYRNLGFNDKNNIEPAFLRMILKDHLVRRYRCLDPNEDLSKLSFEEITESRSLFGVFHILHQN
jgi:hypothetical protein